MTNFDPETHEVVPEPQTLLEGVNRLSQHVVALTERIDVSQRQTRTLKWLVGVVILATIVGGGILGYLLYKVHDNVQTNQHNAVLACQNANDSRQANLALWTFILDEQATKHHTPQQEQLTNEFRQWIGALYATHDCSDLGKTYTIPPPPTIG